MECRGLTIRYWVNHVDDTQFIQDIFLRLSSEELTNSHTLIVGNKHSDSQVYCEIVEIYDQYNEINGGKSL